MDMKAIARTIRGTALTGKRFFGRQEVLIAFVKAFSGSDDLLQAVWKLEYPDAWFFTFVNSQVASDVAG